MTEQLDLPTRAEVPDVVKSVTVPGSPARAWAVFTGEPTAWWPPTHCLLRGAAREAVVIEPGVGGRFYDLGVDGSTARWGQVLVWEPAARLRLSWAVDGTWQPVDDDDLASRIEVTFVEGPDDTTVVTLGHVELERHGRWARAIHGALQGPSPGETLARYGAVVAGRDPDAATWA